MDIAQLQMRLRNFHLIKYGVIIDTSIETLKNASDKVTKRVPNHGVSQDEKLICIELKERRLEAPSTLLTSTPWLVKKLSSTTYNRNLLMGTC